MTVDKFARTEQERVAHATLLLTGWTYKPGDPHIRNDYDVYCADGSGYAAAEWTLEFFGEDHTHCDTRWRLVKWNMHNAFGSADRWYHDDPFVLLRNYQRQCALVDAGEPVSEEILT